MIQRNETGSNTAGDKREESGKKIFCYIKETCLNSIQKVW